MAEKRTIDWASAEVKDGVLLVALTGASSKDWSERFEGVLRLLEQSNGAWGGVGLSKKAIEVKSVQPAGERDCTTSWRAWSCKSTQICPVRSRTASRPSRETIAIDRWRSHFARWRTARARCSS
jgi:hypothetical protein